MPLLPHGGTSCPWGQDCRHFVSEEEDLLIDTSLEMAEPEAFTLDAQAQPLNVHQYQAANLDHLKCKLILLLSEVLTNSKNKTED